MPKLCCYSKSSCSGNAPRGLVSSAGGGSTCNGLQCHDFSTASCCYSSACADITDQPQQRKILNQPNHRTVWDWQDFPTLLQLKHWYKVWEKIFSTEKTLIFWLDNITHYNLILNKLSWSYNTSIHLVTYSFSNKKQLGLKFSGNLLQLLWPGPPQKVISRGFFLLKSRFPGEEWDVWKIAMGTNPNTEVYKHS